MYAQIIDGTAHELGETITSGDVYFSRQSAMMWSDEERAAHGIYPVVDDAIPEGKTVTGSSLEAGEGVVYRRFTLIDTPPAPAPESISDRQFFQALALAKVITQDEALAAVKTGEIPAALDAFIGTLAPDAQFGARMVLCGAVEFHRSHALTKQFAKALGWSDEQVADLWRTAARL